MAFNVRLMSERWLRQLLLLMLLLRAFDEKLWYRRDIPLVAAHWFPGVNGTRKI